MLLLAAILVVATATPFFTWNINSLWGDELFSLYFSDPSQNVAGALSRSLEDVHPPTYYLILYGLRRVMTLDPVLVGRAFSAACAASSLIVLWFATRRFLSTMAGLLMMVTAALSLPYFGQSVEIRSYAFVFLLVALTIAFALRWTAPGAKRPRWQPPIFVLFLIASTTVHYYLVFVTAMVLAFLLANARDWTERAFWVVGGLTIAVFSRLFLAWHQGFIVPDMTLDGPGNLSTMNELKLGIIMIARSPILIALALVAPFCIPWRKITEELPRDLRKTLGAPATLAVFGSLGTIAMALAFSFAVEPVFAARLFTVIIPFIWLWSGILFQIVLDRDDRGLFLTLFLVAALWSAGRIADRFQQLNPDYRAASAQLTSEAGCGTEPIGVAGFRQQFVRGDEEEVFYGYYHDFGTRLRLVRAGRPAPEIAADVAAMVGGNAGWHARRCPTLLWSGRIFSRPQLGEIGLSLERSKGFPASCRTAVVEFPTFPLTSVTELPPPLRRPTPRFNGDMLFLRMVCRPTAPPAAARVGGNPGDV